MSLGGPVSVRGSFLGRRADAWWTPRYFFILTYTDRVIDPTGTVLPSDEADIGPPEEE